MMEFVNDTYDYIKGDINPQFFKEILDQFLIILSPYAPHLSEELWHFTGRESSVFDEKWPKYDENILKEREITIAVQINGKVRATVKIEADTNEESVKSTVLQNDRVKQYTEGKNIKKFIYIKNKIVNIVI